MSIPIRRIELKEQTNFFPHGVLGYCLTRTHYFDPVFSEIKLDLKTVVHAPQEKLLDLLVSILAGCRTVAQVNTRIRPDRVLAQAWYYLPSYCNPLARPSIINLTISPSISLS